MHWGNLMIGKFSRLAGLIGFTLVLSNLSGCAIYHWFSPSDTVPPAPLIKFTPTQQVRELWSVDVGESRNAPMTPAVLPDGEIYAASDKGSLERIDEKGHVVWRIHTRHDLSGGVGADKNIEVVGAYDGTVLAYDSNGKLLWHAQASNQIVGVPAISNQYVVVRSLDGHVEAFSRKDGKSVWNIERELPPLIIKSHSGPVINGTLVWVGYPGGRLIGIDLLNGNEVFDLRVAEPRGATDIDRAVDVTGAPVITRNNNICAVAYQGRLACFDGHTGNLVWGRSLSSSAGITASEKDLFVSGQNGSVYAFDFTTGASLWRQPALRGRSLSTPQVWGDFVVVGDYQGYIHFIYKSSGIFAARLSTDGTPVVIRPQFAARGLVIQTTGGTLSEITLQ